MCIRDRFERLLFAGGPEAARTVLSAVAGSLITATTPTRRNAASSRSIPRPASCGRTRSPLPPASPTHPAKQSPGTRGLSSIGTVSHVWVSRGPELAGLAGLLGSLGRECRLGEGLVDDADRDSHCGGDGADGFAACAAGENGGALVVVDDWSSAPDSPATTCGF